jgi:hypothetical protein
MLSVTLALGFLVAPWPAPRPASAAFLSDAASHPPPTTGGYPYGTFNPSTPGFPAQGQSFVDPVFGNTITRLTNEFPSHSISDIYAKNGFINADATIFVHAHPGGRSARRTSDGSVIRSLPGTDNASFDPVDPDVWWWYSIGGTALNKYSVSAGANTVVKTFSQPIANNGGSTDWIDATGRYMVLRLGNTWRIYDVVGDVLYAGAVSDVDGGGQGWGGISPDAKYLVTTNDAHTGHKSFAIDHATRSVNTTGVMFWSLCGDHGDLVSASNGKTYLVTFECDAVAAVYAVDVSLPQSLADKNKQRTDNRMLFQTEWSDSGHFSGVSRGPLRDWAYVSVESGDDTFGSSVSSWRPYKQEIVMANVVTGEVRRLAHHRSRSPQANYYHTPRVSASWDGSLVTFASNFGYNGNGYVDIYALRVDTGGTTPPPGDTGETGGSGGVQTPPPVTLSFSNPADNATVTGNVTVTVGASGGTGSTYTVKAGADTIYTGTSGTFTWNTTTTANGPVTLTATLSGGGATASATRNVTVSNTPPVTLAFSTPADNATVTGNVTVTVGASGGTGSTYTVKAGADTIYTGTSGTFTWNTTTTANGPVTLTATLSGGGATASATRNVTVSNTTGSGGTGGTGGSGGTGGTGSTGSGTTENVVWMRPRRVVVSGNKITKTEGCNGCWNAGAVSQQSFTAGSGAIEFTTSPASSVAVGFVSTFTSGLELSKLKYGLKFYGTYVEVREAGKYKADWPVKAGDVHKIAIDGTAVKYYLNGVVKYTSQIRPTYPLWVSSTIEVIGHSVQGARFTRGGIGSTTVADSSDGTGSGGTGPSGTGSGDTGSGGTGSSGTGSGGTGSGGTGSGGTGSGGTGSGGTGSGGTGSGGTGSGGTGSGGTGSSGAGSGGTGSGGTGTLTAQNVVWTSPQRVAVVGNSITKTSGCDGCWDSGAASQQAIGSGNGYVEFRTSAGPTLSVGLSNGNPGTTVTEIAYALKFFGGYVEVREKGVYKDSWNIVAGDVHRIAVDGGVVKYFLNGVVKYVSAVAPTYPLLVDSTIELVGQAVQNAIIAY